MSGIRALFILAVLAPAAAVAQAAIPRPIVITDVTVIDTAGGPAQPHRTVTVRDGRIASIDASGGPAPKGADVLDGRGKFLIPGLWDMHVHLSWTTASAMPVLVANGITSVRDMGGRLSELDDWRTKAATETLFEGTFSAALPDGDLPAAIRRFRAEGADALFARFVKNGTIVTPTLIAYGSIIASMDRSAPPDPLLRYVAASLKAEAKKQEQPVSAADLEAWKRNFAELREVVRHLHRSGVALMTGTDVAGPRVPGFPLHKELALLVEAGLTPLQALQASTTTPARLLKKTADLGSIETGKLADLVLLDADPREDIRNTRRISAVVLAGRLLRRADLDSLLRDAETQASAN